MVTEARAGKGKGGRPTVGPAITIKVPPTLLARVDAAAHAAGLTRAEWVRRAAEAALAR